MKTFAPVKPLKVSFCDCSLHPASCRSEKLAVWHRVLLIALLPYFFQPVSCFDFYRKLERAKLQCLHPPNGFVRNSSGSVQLLAGGAAASVPAQAGSSCLLSRRQRARGILHLHQNHLEIPVSVLRVPPKCSATALNCFPVKEEERLHPPELAAGLRASTYSLCSHGVAVWWWLCPYKRYYVNVYKALRSLHRIGGCLSSCALCSLQARGSAAATRSRVLLLHRSAEPRAERRAVRLPPRAPPGPALLGR